MVKPAVHATSGFSPVIVQSRTALLTLTMRVMLTHVAPAHLVPLG